MLNIVKYDVCKGYLLITNKYISFDTKTSYLLFKFSRLQGFLCVFFSQNWIATNKFIIFVLGGGGPLHYLRGGRPSPVYRVVVEWMCHNQVSVATASYQRKISLTELELYIRFICEKHYFPTKYTNYRAKIKFLRAIHFSRWTAKMSRLISAVVFVVYL